MHPAAAALRNSWSAAATAARSPRAAPPLQPPPLQQQQPHLLLPPSRRYAPSPTAALLKRHWSDTQEQPKERFARVSWGSGGTGTTPIKPRLAPGFGGGPQSSPLGAPPLNGGMLLNGGMAPGMAPHGFAAFAGGFAGDAAFMGGGGGSNMQVVPTFSRPPAQMLQQGAQMAQRPAALQQQPQQEPRIKAEHPGLGSPVSGGSGGATPSRSSSGGRSLLQVHRHSSIDR